MRLTPPRRARRRIAGLVMPWMLSRNWRAVKVRMRSVQQEREKAHNLAVTLRSSLAESLAALSASRHDVS